MEIRKTTEADLPKIQILFDQARASMEAAGIRQWSGDYPSAQDARADMEQGTAYVLTEGGEVLATACLAFGREPTYNVMREGSWSGDPQEYGFLHRIAVAPQAKGKGAAGLMFQELARQARERGISTLRGDTHRDNLPMQRVLEKCGYQYRGVILVEDGTERLAFELILPD